MPLLRERGSAGVNPPNDQPSSLITTRAIPPNNFHPVPGSDQFFRANHLLSEDGTDIRYMLSKKYPVNLRTDFAWGKDNFTQGVGVGEAF